MLPPSFNEGDFILEDLKWSKRAGLMAGGALLAALGAKYSAQPSPVRPAFPQPAPRQMQPQPPRPAPKPFVEPPRHQEVISVDDAMDFIEDFEGVKMRSYKDSKGKRTVGVGFNLDAPGAKQTLRQLGIPYQDVRSGRRKLSQDEVDRLFRTKVVDAMSAAKRLVPDIAERPKPIQMAVTDMIYNLGPTGFSKFGDLRAALDRDDYQAAAKAMRSSGWARDVGGRADTLIDMVANAGGPVLASNTKLGKRYDATP